MTKEQFDNQAWRKGMTAKVKFRNGIYKIVEIDFSHRSIVLTGSDGVIKRLCVAVEIINPQY